MRRFEAIIIDIMFIDGYIFRKDNTPLKTKKG